MPPIAITLAREAVGPAQSEAPDPPTELVSAGPDRPDRAGPLERTISPAGGVALT